MVPGGWQGSSWSTNLSVSLIAPPGKILMRKTGFEPGSADLGADDLTTWPTINQMSEPLMLWVPLFLVYVYLCICYDVCIALGSSIASLDGA